MGGNNPLYENIYAFGRVFPSSLQVLHWPGDATILLFAVISIVGVPAVHTMPLLLKTCAGIYMKGLQDISNTDNYISYGKWLNPLQNNGKTAENMHSVHHDKIAGV